MTPGGSAVAAPSPRRDGRNTVAQSPATLKPSALSSLPALPDTQAEFDFMAGIAEEFLESNPRRIKRLLNTYRYVKILSSVAGQPVESEDWQRDALAWLAFTMKWPSFMERAIEQAATPGVEPKAEGFLLKIAGGAGRGDGVPGEEEIKAYLPFSAEKVRLYRELAGNFLIENPRPRAAAEEAEQPRPPAGPS